MDFVVGCEMDENESIYLIRKFTKRFRLSKKSKNCASIATRAELIEKSCNLIQNAIFMAKATNYRTSSYMLHSRL